MTDGSGCLQSLSGFPFSLLTSLYLPVFTVLLRIILCAVTTSDQSNGRFNAPNQEVSVAVRDDEVTSPKINYHMYMDLCVKFCVLGIKSTKRMHYGKFVSVCSIHETDRRILMNHGTKETCQ